MNYNKVALFFLFGHPGTCYSLWAFFPLVSRSSNKWASIYLVVCLTYFFIKVWLSVCFQKVWKLLAKIDCGGVLYIE